MDRKKILIVDDEESIRILVKRFLGRHYSVLEAENGEIAIDIAKREKPDLILMDIMMPKVDGYTACAEIKANELTRGTQVIMLTSIAYQLNKKLAQKIGADGYVTKPLDLQELHQTVERFLGTS
jgi:two-component system alkaline phosphatase synthesis response regulator PhoP